MTPVVANDLYHHTKILSLHSHAGSDRLVFCASRAQKASDTYSGSLWVTTFGSTPGEATPLTRTGPASYPRLCPDGRQVAFLGKRGTDKRPAPYVIPVDGGEAWRVAGLKGLQVDAIEEWSSDGKRLLVRVSVPHAEDGRDDVSHPARPHVVKFLPYKIDGNGYSVGARTHLYEVDVSGRDLPRCLTSGERDVISGTWSPDGRRLAFVARGDGDQRHRTSLWQVEEGGRPQLVTDAFPLVGELTWSPDGTRLAFSAGEIEGYSASHAYLWDSEGVQGPLITDPLEGGLAWSPSGDRLAAIVGCRGLFQLATFAPDGSDLCVHDLGNSQMSLLAACGAGLVTVRASYTELDEIIAVSWEPDAPPRRMTCFNERLSERLGVQCECRSFQVPDGQGGEESVDAWLLRGLEHGDEPRPLLVDMHGGPHSVALMDFASHTYLYALLAAGWIVVAPNTAGSSSYGDEFALRLQGRWGELDFPQIQSIVAQLKEEGTASDQVACSGKSYGAFLSAWAISHGPEFRAAMVSAPVADMASHAGTSDSGYYVTPFAMGGSADECRARYDALSPVEYVSNAHGPVLLLNGDHDQRCPLGQAEQLFTRLLRLGCQPATLVVYPGGTHSMAATGRPSHRADYHGRIVEFFQDAFAGVDSTLTRC